MITNEMYSEHFFMPNIIHGSEDIIASVCLNDEDNWIIEYISKDSIIKAKDETMEDFYEALDEEAGVFIVENGTDYFKEMCELWTVYAEPMSKEDLVSWAKGE